MRTVRTIALAVIGISLVAAGVHTQAPAPRPTLYLVSNSHLDTQWDWTVQDTIRDLVPSTFYDNFKLFDRFPGYVFNFEGAIHYMWFKEYHPDDWPTVQKHVAAGRWRLAGSWINAVDGNVPSSEALMRQALYGKRFQRHEFGVTSQDIYLPDCFGFGFALPSIGAHSGLQAFSTQKLSWGAARPTPFAVGLWQGADGSSLVAALRGGDYVKKITTDISTDPAWNADLTPLEGGRKVGFRYFGVGDIGGAPDAASVEWAQKAIANPAGAVEVRNTSADQLSRDLTAAERASMPVYKGELLMKTHGVGCYTSQAAMKLFNRRNELLADAAERASVAAAWLGGLPYPRERIRTAWIRFLWHQFHDDLTGTSIPQAYQFSWNDELLSLNQFAGTLASAVGAVASGLDTRPAGAPAGAIPVVVFNPLAVTRRDPVAASLVTGGAPFAGVRVVDAATGEAVPAQLGPATAGRTNVTFVADVPPVSFKVFHVVRAAAAAAADPALAVTTTSLENARYAVRIDANGDVASIVDKQAGTELLKAPARLELFDNPSFPWPAWEILWDTVNRPPRAYVKDPMTGASAAGTPAPLPIVRVVERGPARVAVEVRRQAAGSTFVQRISLAEGGDRVEFETTVDWRTPGTLLKASFPLTASAATATYDLGLGTIERPNSTSSLYEVPAQQWADLTDSGGRFGAAIMNDSKYGWDKPADNELRLTLIHTPRPNTAFVYQSSNDVGRHRFTYAVAGHAGGWREGRVPTRAARLNQPLIAFQAPAHEGVLGRSLSLLRLGDPIGQVAVRAFKQAEDSDELIVRVQELFGLPVDGLSIELPGGILQAREINAAEEPVGPATVSGGKMSIALKPYQPRSFAITPAAPIARLAAPASAALPLAFNLDGVSADGARSDGDFDGRGRTYPAELFPDTMELDGITFTFGPSSPGAKNVMTAGGQRLALPPGGYNRVYLLASALGGDVATALRIERGTRAPRTEAFTVQEWTGPIGQWDTRLRDDRMMRSVFVPPFKDQTWPLATIQSQMVTTWIPAPKPAAPPAGAAKPAPAAKAPPPSPFATATGRVIGLSAIRRGFVKRDEVAWVATHRHDAKGNEPYIFGYVFKYGFDIPEGATAIVLPADARVRVFAVSVAREAWPGTRPAGVLYGAGLAATPPPPVPAPAPAAVPVTK